MAAPVWGAAVAEATMPVFVLPDPVRRALVVLLLLLAGTAGAAEPWDVGRGWFAGADRVGPAEGTPPAAAVPNTCLVWKMASDSAKRTKCTESGHRTLSSILSRFNCYCWAPFMENPSN